MTRIKITCIAKSTIVRWSKLGYEELESLLVSYSSAALAGDKSASEAIQVINRIVVKRFVV